MNHYKTHYNLSKNKIIMIMAGLMVGLLVAALDNSIISTAMLELLATYREWNTMYGHLHLTC